MIERSFEEFQKFITNLKEIIETQRTIRVYLESIFTGYTITFTVAGMDIQKNNKKINVKEFFLDMHKLHISEYLLYGDNSEPNIDSTTRTYHFIIETGILLFDTYYRKTSSVENINEILDHDLYKHLIIMYNTRAKQDSIDSKNLIRTFSSKFKYIYLALPSFTELYFVNDQPKLKDFLGIDLDSFHKIVKPVVTLPSTIISNLVTVKGLLSEEKYLEMYTATSLVTAIQDEELPMDLCRKLTKPLISKKYAESLMTQYWFTDLIQIRINPNSAAYQTTFKILTMDNAGVLSLGPRNITSSYTLDELKKHFLFEGEIKFQSNNLSLQQMLAMELNVLGGKN